MLDALLQGMVNNNTLDESRKEFTNKIIVEFKKQWTFNESKVITAIETLTKNDFKDNLNVYFLPDWPNKKFKFTAISDPIIITVKRPVTEIINLLVHELIHQNLKGIKLQEKYDLFKGETKLTQKHIIIHAILKEVLTEVFGVEHYELDKKMCEDWVDFKRAWNIVDEKGSKEIIKLFLD